jgi:hypothetical protein
LLQVVAVNGAEEVADLKDAEGPMLQMMRKEMLLLYNRRAVLVVTLRCC